MTWLARHIAHLHGIAPPAIILTSAVPREQSPGLIGGARLLDRLFAEQIYCSVL
jgi:hypothetical protein